ncbi:Ldh family oxidoreductase [Falsiroseomonas sp. CW058]|uniref:Ldh family oxidoreductase n=1 Tax=Falsiroseomonas sp. CW058 TaxID=3388664 RepID=UPI003D31AD9A
MDAIGGDATPRHAAAALVRLAAELATRAGLEAEKAGVLAEVLVEADLLGHGTHGLALLPRYLDDIATGAMRREGEPEVVRDRGAAIAWRGLRLPGPWLVRRAIDLALDRAATYGSCTVAIADSHHIACLAAYLTQATDRGCMVVLSTSAPAAATVAPFGGRGGVLAPDPVAAGIPTDGDPILIDISASITTNNMAMRMAREGRLYPHEWLIDAAGNPSRDPRVLDAGGALLPAGGLDHGQKGYGWALLTEALTQGLSGFGRADAPKGLCGAVTVQVLDPDAFGGREAFLRQTSWTAAACRAAPPLPGVERVRLPGEAGLAHRRQALAAGVALSPAILSGLEAAAAKLGLAMPAPLTD